MILALLAACKISPRRHRRGTTGWIRNAAGCTASVRRRRPSERAR